MTPFSKTEYSEKEVQMFLELGFEEEHLDYMLKNLTAWVIYSLAARKCFVEDLEGPAVNSLKLCLKAWDDKNVKRRTEEWDQMISF
jgi:hypothetical protein